MKKILLLLLLTVTYFSSAQSTYSIAKPLQLQTVNESTSKSDSVLVRGEDKIVKFVPRSNFVSGLATITYVDSLNAKKVDNVSGERLITASEITNLSNQSGINTGNNAANSNYDDDYRSSNFVAGADYLTPTGSAAGLTSFPTFNQNTTGSASTITGNITESQVDNLVSDLAGKQSTLVSGTNIRTINGTTLLGSGDIAIAGGSLPNGTLRTAGSGVLTSSLQQISDNTNVISPLRLSTVTVTSTGTTNSANTNNTAFGVGANASNLTGSRNTAFGFVANNLMTNGTYNTAIGNGALAATTGSNKNTAIGTQVLSGANVVGDYNTGLGAEAGLDFETGAKNIFIGYQAGRYLVTGTSNILIGVSSYLNPSSNYNVIIGNLNVASFDRVVLSNNVILADGQGNKRLQIDDTGKTNLLGKLSVATLGVYADNAAAIAGGVPVNEFYRTSTGVLMVRY